VLRDIELHGTTPQTDNDDTTELYALRIAHAKALKEIELLKELLALK
jgi:hypothetical protein